jgi:O-antigen/teichoic acid export membrane protein
MAIAVAWNAAARSATQLLSWMSIIVVARLLTPADYGLIGMAGFYLNLVLLISQAGIGDTIIALRDLTQRQIAELNTVAVLLGIGLVGLSCALAPPLSKFFSAPLLSGVIVVSSLMYLINGFQIVPKALLQKDLEFKRLAFIDTVRAVTQILVTILLAFLKFGYWSLVAGYMIGCLTNSVMTFLRRRHGFALPDVQQLGRALKFSRNIMLSNLAWYTYDNADFGVAGRVLGEVPLGNYTVAWTISSAPVEKIANLITSVTPAYFSALQSNKPELCRYLVRLTEMLSLVTFPASIGIVLSADYLVPVLLGPKWYAVIGPLRLLGILIAAKSLITILPAMLNAIGDSSFVMRISLCAAVIMPVAFLIGSRWGTNGIATSWIVAYPIIAIPILRRVMKRIGLSWKDYTSAILPALSGSGIMVVGVLGVRILLRSRPHSLFELSSLIAAGAVIYVVALWLLHGERVVSLVKITKTMLLGKSMTQASSQPSI